MVKNMKLTGFSSKAIIAGLFEMRYFSKSDKYSTLLWPITISIIDSSSLYGVHMPSKEPYIIF